MKSLNETIAYKYYNKNNAITETVGKMFGQGMKLNAKNLELPLLTIKKNYKFGTKPSISRMMESGQIELLYAPAGVQMPTQMPFILFKDNGMTKAAVCVDLYGNIDKENHDVDINPKVLYTLMESAMLAIIYVDNEKSLCTNAIMLKQSTEIYVGMFMRILNKKFQLTLDPDKYNTIAFLVANFYLREVLCYKTQDETTYFNYAITVCKNPNRLILQDLYDSFPFEEATDLEKFLQLLSSETTTKSITPHLGVRDFLENYANMFGPSALLSLESMPYFIHNLNSAMRGTHMNKQALIIDIMGKSGTSIPNVVFNKL